MISSKKAAVLLSVLLSLTVFAEDPVTAKTKKEIKAETKAAQKKQDAITMANDTDPVIKKSEGETALGLTTTLGSLQWNKSQQDPANISKFKSDMTVEFYGRQTLVFDPKRNSLRLSGNKIYGYFDGESKSNLGGGAGLLKDTGWKTSITASKLRISGGAQLGDNLNVFGGQSGFILGGSVVIDENSGKTKDLTTGKQVTAFKDLTIDVQGQAGMGALQIDNNLISLMVPVGFRFKNEQEPEFQANNLMGPMFGLQLESDQKITTAKGKVIGIKTGFSETDALLKNKQGQSLDEYKTDMSVKVAFPISKNTRLKMFVKGAISANNEKDYDLSSAAPKTPVSDRTYAGGELGVGIVF